MGEDFHPWMGAGDLVRKARYDSRGQEQNDPLLNDKSWTLSDLMKELAANKPNLSMAEKRALLALTGVLTIALITASFTPIDTNQGMIRQSEVFASPTWSASPADLRQPSSTPTPEQGRHRHPTKKATLEQFTEKLATLAPTSQQVEQVNYSEPAKRDTEKPAEFYDRAVIHQTDENGCGPAVLAMMLADLEDADPVKTYQEIMKYYGMDNKPELLLGRQALVEHLRKSQPEATSQTMKFRWTADQLTAHLEKFGSTIVDVTSHYGKESVKNPANHWIIIDEIVLDNHGNQYAVVREPLRNETGSPSPVRKLTSFMSPYEQGTILIPLHNLLPAMGKSAVFIDNQ